MDIEFIPGTLGWAAVRQPAEGDALYVRFAERGGRLVVSELWTKHDPGISSDRLRRIPMGRIEALANGPFRAHLLALMSSDEVSPDPAHLVTAALGGESMARERMRELNVPESEIDRILLDVVGSVSRKPNAKVAVPKSRPYPATFYRGVADRYMRLAALGSRKPAVEIADASGVPVSTVHRWIKESRRQGLLPEGQRGKLG